MEDCPAFTYVPNSYHRVRGYHMVVVGRDLHTFRCRQYLYIHILCWGWVDSLYSLSLSKYVEKDEVELGMR